MQLISMPIGMRVHTLDLCAVLHGHMARHASCISIGIKSSRHYGASYEGPLWKELQTPLHDYPARLSAQGCCKGFDWKPVVNLYITSMCGLCLDIGNPPCDSISVITAERSQPEG